MAVGGVTGGTTTAASCPISRLSWGEGAGGGGGWAAQGRAAAALWVWHHLFLAPILLAKHLLCWPRGSILAASHSTKSQPNRWYFPHGIKSPVYLYPLSKNTSIIQILRYKCEDWVHNLLRWVVCTKEFLYLISIY